MKRTLELRVGSAASALDRLEETWNKAARGEKAPAEHVLTFVNLQLLLRTLTPARWTLLERLRADGLTLVVVTHDARVARRAGRVLVMADGRVTRHLASNEIT